MNRCSFQIGRERWAFLEKLLPFSHLALLCVWLYWRLAKRRVVKVFMAPLIMFHDQTGKYPHQLLFILHHTQLCLWDFHFIRYLFLGGENDIPIFQAMGPSEKKTIVKFKRKYIHKNIYFILCLSHMSGYDGPISNSLACITQQCANEQYEYLLIRD